MKKKLFATLLTSVLALSAITGCSKDASNSEPAENTQNTEDAAKEGDGDLEVITVAATAVPHAEILESEVVTSALAAKGYKVEVTVFEDYVQPNNVVDAGEFDANYFQHITYLNDFNDQNGTSLVNAGGIHYEPFGIYGGTKKSLDEIADGDTIAIPNDTTNEARALLLLEANELIKLEDGVGLTATVNNIAENPYNLKIVEVEAAQVPHQIDSVSYAVMNGNYAMEAGFTVATDALAYESQDSEAAEKYVNVIAVKEGNESNPGIVALVEVLKSDEVKAWIEEQYEGSVVPYEGK
ncbi:MetQ/NlpA family ABC transporter substrate-binding protein [Butyrivibrio sp. TB]|uniref:MetQ/NlpA family ABC transporter substrate-binding protein n=1 Tax=Butyrivibrio sp. TB TaxID=1520809 RepID=UPI0008C01AF2|nr:MetQ/NlpA family ABC transporter substrate-binding protein [Butyrivibrio sp. TB]SEQ44594.1 D-methionine transport system substrate-binding protein [Butyrivibrio sp. TB]